MTPDELIAETLRLDAEATKGPWSYATWPKTSDGRQSPSIIADGGYGVLACDGPENGPHSRDAEAITVYRTAAPLLARIAKMQLEYTAWAANPCHATAPTRLAVALVGAERQALPLQHVARYVFAEIARIAEEG